MDRKEFEEIAAYLAKRFDKPVEEVKATMRAHIGCVAEVFGVTRANVAQWTAAVLENEERNKR